MKKVEYSRWLLGLAFAIGALPILAHAEKLTWQTACLAIAEGAIAVKALITDPRHQTERKPRSKP